MMGALQKLYARRAYVFAFLGVFLLAKGLYIPLKAELAQLLLERAWQRSQVEQKSVKAWPWADTEPVAKLTYKTHQEIILQDASGASMAFGPAHVGHSAPLGSDGNAVVAAHRDTHFSFLEEVKKGEIMSLETREKEKVFYRVLEMGVVDKADTRVLAEEVSGVLTLITCFPFDAVVPGGRERYVVRLEKVEHPQIVFANTFGEV